ncbi:unnamed protein product [Trifolium pratense]|uniref:Uncharacterized protein n=1 Tax=Trifolium pratense TaxID=57577 RepID=A0ACB0IGP2_TRIPR|nr:unnamed protein product [Trifolium pratense]
MPVSGHEESGVKSFAGQFSDLVAGVPIKKRRYPPYIKTSSPPSEEPCSNNEETESQRKENSSTSQGSTLSNASIAGAPIKKRRFPPSLQASSPSLEEGSVQQKSYALRKDHSSTSLGSTLSTSSAGLSNTIGNPLFEEKKSRSDVTKADKVQNNSSLLTPKREESNPTLNVVNSKEKVTLNEVNEKNVGSQTSKANTELVLAAKEGLALSIGADVSKQIVQGTVKQESPVVAGSTRLSLSIKEHVFQSVTSRENNEIRPNMEKGEPLSLELSLSKDECSTHSSNTDAKSDSDTTRVHSSRANWDLNTTMDAWDEGSDASSVKTSIDGLNITHSSLDEKLLMCSTGITPPTSVVSVKQTRNETQNKAFITSPGLAGQQYKRADPPSISFSSYVCNYVEEPSRRISVKLNSGVATPVASLPSVAATAGAANTSSFRSVKPEPYDENLKKNLKETRNSCPVGSLDSAAVKQEIIQHSITMQCKPSVSNSKLVDSTFVKSEPSHEGSQEQSKTAESTNTKQLDKVLPQMSFSSSMAVPVMNSTQVFAEATHPAVKPVCTTVLTTNKNIVGQLKTCSRAEGVNVEKLCEVPSNSENVPLVTVAIPMVDTATELNNLGLKYSSIVAKKEVADDHDACRLKLMNEPLDPRESEGCVSDEEKITDILEDDSYGSDLESDENPAVTVAVDTERYIEDDDYEDGEVREPLETSKLEETICEVREIERSDLGNYDNKLVEKGVVSSDYPTSSHVVENDNKIVNHNEIISKDGVDIQMHDKPGKVIDKKVCVHESLDGEKSDIAADKGPVNVLQRKSLDLSERIIVSEIQETEQHSDHATDGSHVIDVQCADEVVKTTDTVRQADLYLPKMEGSSNTEDITRDVSSCGNQGRIIDLSRAASSSSPSKTRPIPVRSLPTRAGRDVLSDTVDGDKLYRGRDDVYIDAPHRFSRERHQDMSTRNSRLNFGRGRGRVNSRIRGDWESDREYSGEFYNGPSQQFRGARSKYSSGIADTDMEYNNVGPDDSYVVNGRLGRKPLNDGSYVAPRRRSPPAGGRDGIQMGHRNPRAVSPNSRCIGGDGSDLGGMRHSEKFMRGFADDTLDSLYKRPQQFEGLDGRFSRGRGRNFSSMQRRGGLSRMRSKSPIRSRSRSPGQWTSPRRRSPRRRSPEGFGGHPEMTHRRSPLYRVDRMRSPDRPVFTGERVVRRHGSPQFISRPSNDMRDIDSARDHGHPRSVNSNRSPSGRILIRNNRRFDVADPRDRADNDDEYFGGGGPMHSGRMLELNNGEGNGEERRRFGERRGPIRSFRPPYNNGNNNNNNVGENFHLNAEDGPTRHYRFCSDDSDFHDRGNNLRERDFDRRIKGRNGNGPPRRTRNMDEPEDNFRHGGQVWSDDSFDDISRVKRKRF